MADGDLVIDIDDPLDGVGEPEPTKTQPRVSSKKADDDRVAELERRLADTTRSSEAEISRTRADLAAAKQEAERSAAESARTLNIAKNSHWEKLQSDQQLIEGALNTSKALEAAAKRDYILAREQADASAEADAVSRLSEHRQSIGQLEMGLADAKEKIARTRAAFTAQEDVKPAKAEPVKAAEPVPQPKQPTADEWIEGAKSAVGEDGANWLREHREFVTDNAMHQKLLTFAKMYELDHGVSALKSDDFRAALDAKFFPGRGDDMADDNEEASAPETRTAPSAPVSRTSPSRPASQTPRGSVRLTPDEQGVAVQMYPNLDRNAALKRYASNKARATAAGRYS